MVGTAERGVLTHSRLEQELKKRPWPFGKRRQRNLGFALANAFALNVQYPSATPETERISA